MTIIMNMNIYITEQNEELLRKYDGSMSGLVNRLLSGFFEGYPSAATGGLKPNEYAATPDKYPRILVNTHTPVAIPGVVKGSEFVSKPPDPETGYPCCIKARPCRHWQWNGNLSAYINSLTGKAREAEL